MAYTLVRPPRIFLFIALLLLAVPSFTLTESIRSTRTFSLSDFTGTWYEIVRTDHILEKNLTDTAAECIMDEQGFLILSTRAFNSQTQKWTRITARVRQPADRQNGQIEVLFLGAFFVPYSIVAMDDSSRYALLSSKNARHMWLLSREKHVPPDIIEEYLNIAKKHNVNTDNLIQVIQNE
jgi:apolipoprotein D and lipocalin family protein